METPRRQDAKLKNSWRLGISHKLQPLYPSRFVFSFSVLKFAYWFEIPARITNSLRLPYDVPHEQPYRSPLMKKHAFPPCPSPLAAWALVGQPRLAHAESLAGRVPADAVAYAEWAGSDNLGKSYDNSHLKKLLEVLNLPQFISQ